MADAGGISITRQPQGLISALEKISEDREPLEAANKATAHLYVVSPFKLGGFRVGNIENGQSPVTWFAKLFNTHPPIEERIKILKQMA